VEHKNESDTSNIGHNGNISKSSRKYPTNIAGKHKIKDPWKTAIFDTAHILHYMTLHTYFIT
jgi:hypothetical protein